MQSSFFIQQQANKSTNSAEHSAHGSVSNSPKRVAAAPILGRRQDVNFIERNKERVSLVSAGTKAFNQLNVPLKTTLTHLVYNNSAGATSTI
jgi:hypothetical protein